MSRCSSGRLSLVLFCFEISCRFAPPHPINKGELTVFPKRTCFLLIFRSQYCEARLSKENRQWHATTSCSLKDLKAPFINDHRAHEVEVRALDCGSILSIIAHPIHWNPFLPIRYIPSAFSAIVSYRSISDCIRKPSSEISCD